MPIELTNEKIETKVMKIRESDYKDRLRKLQNISEMRAEMRFSENSVKALKMGEDVFLTVDLLMEHEVEEHFRDYLNYLLYYAYFCESEDPAFLESKEYILEVIDEKLIIIDDDTFSECESLRYAQYRMMTLEEKADFFRPYMEMYQSDELNDFVLDLGFCKFFRNLGILRSRMDAMKKERIEIFRPIWDLVWNK